MLKWTLFGYRTIPHTVGINTNTEHMQNVKYQRLLGVEKTNIRTHPLVCLNEIDDMIMTGCFSTHPNKFITDHSYLITDKSFEQYVIFMLVSKDDLSRSMILKKKGFFFNNHFINHIYESVEFLEKNKDKEFSVIYSDMHEYSSFNNDFLRYNYLTSRLYQLKNTSKVSDNAEIKLFNGTFHIIDKVKGSYILDKGFVEEFAKFTLLNHSTTDEFTDSLNKAKLLTSENKTIYENRFNNNDLYESSPRPNIIGSDESKFNYMMDKINNPTDSV